MAKHDDVPGEQRLQRIGRVERGDFLADPLPVRPMPGRPGASDQRRQGGYHAVDFVVADLINRRRSLGGAVGNFDRGR
jgi:hypothetical protein